MPEAAVATAQQAATEAIGRLASAGVENPALDAQLLLAHALGMSREALWMRYREPVHEPGLARFWELVARREAREPTAYILGHKAFRNIELSVDQRVLVPRPESELLVEVGLTLDQGVRVADLGTGSGAIALALKDERPDLDVWGTDASSDALDVARANARRLGLDVAFVQADLLEGVNERSDAVLGNLPYVEAEAELPPEISRYEPRRALHAGADGLETIRRLVGQLGGIPLVALEVGASQATAVKELLSGAGFLSVESLLDLAGHERVVVGRR